MRNFVGVFTIAAIVGVACIMVRSGTAPKVQRYFHTNGRLAVEHGVDSRGWLHGDYRVWDENGTLRQHHVWVHGLVTSRRVYDETGKFQSGEQEGPGYQMVPISE